MSWTRIMQLLFSLTLMLQPAAIAAAPPGGLGPYRLGMKPADVQAVKDCAPYKPVKTTGGLECAKLTIAGKTRNISFIFDPDAGLKKSQLWFAEAATPADAFVFASIFKDPTHGWFVFFYVQPPRTTTAPH